MSDHKPAAGNRTKYPRTTFPEARVLALRGHLVFPSTKSLVTRRGSLAVLRRSLVLLTIGLVALGACASPAPTKVAGLQVTRPSVATVHGIVHDTNGQPHPGATVTIDGLGQHATNAADGKGAYSFTNLPAGTYVLTVNADDSTTPGTGGVRIGGTTRSSRKEITLHLGDNLVDAESGF